MTEKRLFFSAEITAIWPLEFPPARIIDEQYRHMTLAFLGLTSEALLKEDLPLPSFQLGVAGYCHEWIFLPNDQAARVVAAGVEWIDEAQDFLQFQAALETWLQDHHYLHKENRPFFPHITVGRGTFDVETWKQAPCLIPFYISGIALQESLGYSRYNPIWRHPLTPPFQEIEHTADIAFLVRGKNFCELLLHAQLALAFKFPPLLSYLAKQDLSSLDSVIKTLNDIIAIADHEIGVPFKAVSYHDEIDSNQFLEWKMIVDV